VTFVSTWIPMLVGTIAIAFTIVVHSGALIANIHLVRRERRLGHLGAGFWVDLRLVFVAMMLALAAHLIEIGVWALLFMRSGEFQAFGIAFYHSAMNYTTLGYGDIVMSPAWRLLGPLEAMDGLLMAGVSTAMIFAVILRLVETRFPDLRR